MPWFKYVQSVLITLVTWNRVNTACRAVPSALYILVIHLSQWSPSSPHLQEEKREARETIKDASKNIQLVNGRPKLPSRSFQDVISPLTAQLIMLMCKNLLYSYKVRQL